MASPAADENLNVYWQEFNDIESNKDGEEDEELSKTPDEGELEAKWLNDAGYGYVVNKCIDGKELSDDELEALTSSLTHLQAEAVKKRITTLTTLRRKKIGKPHVKDIFPSTDSSSPEPPSPDGLLEEPPSFPTGANLISFSRQRPPFLPRKGGYTLDEAAGEPLKSIGQGVEAVSFKGRSTIAKPSLGRPLLPAISDADISIDFQFELKDSKTHQPKGDPHEVDLPALSVKQDPLGMTLIGDLSPGDLVKIRSLALIELTALFDLYNITYSRPKRKKKPREHGLFGVPLQTLVEQDQKRFPETNTKVPLIFKEMVAHLEKEALTSEGILRIPGAVLRVKHLRHELEDKFYGKPFDWKEVCPNDAASLLKQFLRDLPVPLLTYDYLEAFPQVERIPTTLEQLKALNLLILLLPAEHRDMLQLLLQFLRNVVAHSDKNKMGLNNISMIMAPNLFLAPIVKGKSKVGGPLELNTAANTSNVVKMLIHYGNILWTVPSSFLVQIRHQYKNEANRKTRDKMRPWRKKDKSEIYKKTAEDVQNGVIRVQAPVLTKSSCLIQLDDTMTAGDIVNKFKIDYGSANMSNQGAGKSRSDQPFNNPSNALFADEKAYLFEVGGTIGERCLDPQTRMLQLYHVNPTADWIIRINVNRPSMSH